MGRYRGSYGVDRRLPPGALARNDALSAALWTFPRSCPLIGSAGQARSSQSLLSVECGDSLHQAWRRSSKIVLHSQNSDPERHHASQGPRFGMGRREPPPRGRSLRSRLPSRWRAEEPLQWPFPLDNCSSRLASVVACSVSDSCAIEETSRLQFALPLLLNPCPFRHPV